MESGGKRPYTSCLHDNEWDPRRSDTSSLSSSSSSDEGDILTQSWPVKSPHNPYRPQSAPIPDQEEHFPSFSQKKQQGSAAGLKRRNSLLRRASTESLDETVRQLPPLHPELHRRASTLSLISRGSSQDLSHVPKKYSSTTSLTKRESRNSSRRSKRSQPHEIVSITPLGKHEPRRSNGRENGGSHSRTKQANGFQDYDDSFNRGASSNNSSNRKEQPYTNGYHTPRPKSNGHPRPESPDRGGQGREFYDYTTPSKPTGRMNGGYAATPHPRMGVTQYSNNTTQQSDFTSRRAPPEQSVFREEVVDTSQEFSREESDPYQNESLSQSMPLPRPHSTHRAVTSGALRIHITTYNMHEAHIPNSLECLLFPPNQQSAHLYVVGTQEGTVARKKWELKLQETLGPSYVPMHSHALMGLQLCVFIQRDLIWEISEVQSAHLPTKMGGMLRTKGGVGICFSFRGQKYLLVNSHLAAHQMNVKDRNNDFATICKSLALPHRQRIQRELSLSRRSVNITDKFDFVFWFGDLNYRVNCNRRMADMLLERRLYDILLANDQLRIQQEEGAAFQDFKEAPITFPPTFKYDLNTDYFDTSSKNRVPAWTDRILYKTTDREAVKNVYYNYVPEMQISDHRPVIAVFEVAVGASEPQLSSTMPHPFNHRVYRRGLRRRQRAADEESTGSVSSRDTRKRDKPSMMDTLSYRSSVICSIM